MQHISDHLAVIFAVLGAVGLVVFGWLVWPPLAVLVFSVQSLAAGLLIDWEAVRGKSARTPPK